MSPTRRHARARAGVAVLLALGFTALYAITLSDADAVFGRGVRSFLWSDIGEWADATRIGTMASLPSRRT